MNSALDQVIRETLPCLSSSSSSNLLNEGILSVDYRQFMHTESAASESSADSPELSPNPFVNLNAGPVSKASSTPMTPPMETAGIYAPHIVGMSPYERAPPAPLSKEAMPIGSEAGFGSLLEAYQGIGAGQAPPVSRHGTGSSLGLSSFGATPSLVPRPSMDISPQSRPATAPAHAYAPAPVPQGAAAPPAFPSFSLQHLSEFVTPPAPMAHVAPVPPIAPAAMHTGMAFPSAPPMVAPAPPRYMFPPGVAEMPKPLVPPMSAPSLDAGLAARRQARRASSDKASRRFVCHVEGCGRAFTRNFNLQSHLKAHLGIREFKCKYCDKRFSRRHDRMRHCAALHKAETESELRQEQQHDHSHSR